MLIHYVLLPRPTDPHQVQAHKDTEKNIYKLKEFKYPSHETSTHHTPIIQTQYPLFV